MLHLLCAHARSCGAQEMHGLGRQLLFARLPKQIRRRTMQQRMDHPSCTDALAGWLGPVHPATRCSTLPPQPHAHFPERPGMGANSQFPHPWMAWVGLPMPGLCAASWLVRAVLRMQGLAGCACCTGCQAGVRGPRVAAAQGGTRAARGRPRRRAGRPAAAAPVPRARRLPLQMCPAFGQQHARPAASCGTARRGRGLRCAGWPPACPAH